MLGRGAIFFDWVALMKSKFITTDKDNKACDIVVDCECHAHILRILKYSDETSLSLMHYSCGLPEDINEKTLCWDILLDKSQAIDLANSILEMYEDTYHFEG